MDTLYHGSNQIIRIPTYGKGNPQNDYGLGFYCTLEPELAKEWACAEDDDGFANKYMLETEGLTCLHLNGGGYHILNWLAILLENRRFDLSSPVSIRARQYILDTFLPDYKEYDLIEGYRADDSYFSFSRAFLANGITLEQLRRAMRLGKLGEQVVLRTPAAFEALSFIEVIKIISNWDCNIIFFDELLDSAVDKNNLDSLFDAIREIVTNNEQCAYIISHRGIEQKKFDHVYLAEKKGRFSTIEEVV